MNNGIDVKITFTNDHESIYHNITEIHYNYRNGLIDHSTPKDSFLREICIAFESDIHQNGYTYPMAEILEFSTTPSKEIAESI